MDHQKSEPGAGIRAKLFEMRDEKYLAFHAGLFRASDGLKMIGVRVPLLRAYARTLSGTEAARRFMDALPHGYVEENHLHAFLIERMRDYDAAMRETERFLPFIDNWATCDSFSPKVFKTRPDETCARALQWLQSDRVYTVRYGIDLLMGDYLKERFRPEYLDAVAAVQTQEYYVRMAQAWYFSMALVHRYEASVGFFTRPVLDPWTHNKAIQKAIESRRIPQAQKDYLRTLKR